MILTIYPLFISTALANVVLNSPNLPIPCSVPGIVFEPRNWTGPGPCNDGMFCKYNLEPFGQCQKCPAAGENCSNIKNRLETVHDYHWCCEACSESGAVCDLEGFIEFLDATKGKAKKQLKISGKLPKPKIATGLSINPLETKDLPEFMQFMNKILIDSKYFPGNIGVDITIEHKNPARGVMKNTVFIYLTWDSMETAMKYYRWRFYGGTWYLLDPWTGGQFETYWDGIGQIRTYHFWEPE